MPIEHEEERETLDAKRRGAGHGTGVDDGGADDGSGLGATLKRTFKEFSADKITDWAAALTYYGVLALFPALIALVSIIGLVGKSATNSLKDNLSSVSPGPAKDILTNAINGLAGNKGAAGFAFVIGIVLALNSASGYIAAFTRASNSIYEVEEGRPAWKLKPLQIGITLVLIILLVIVIVGIAVTGPVATQAGKLIGAGSSFQTVWDLAKIPVLLVVVSLMLAFLYWAAPNVKQPGFKFISPGGVVALVLFIVASLLFSLYVANFSSYNKTYGSLGGVIAFLVWLWITNIAVLFGAEFNAELQRSKQRKEGVTAPLDEPFLEPRDVSKLEKKEKKD